MPPAEPGALKRRAAALWADERARFLAVGGWNTAFGYVLFFVLYTLLGKSWHYLVVGGVSHFVSVTQSYVTQRFLVFRSREPWWPEYLRFHLAQAGLFALSAAGLSALVELLHLDPRVAQLFVLCVSVVASYVVHRFFSFRRRPAGEPPPAS